MYEDFFGLEEKPFRLTPDADFFFPSRQHRRALAYLEYGLDQGEGFIVITGEPGTGKSTLVGALMLEHGSDPLRIATVETTNLEGASLLEYLCARFEFPAAGGHNKAQLLGALESGFKAVERRGERCVIIMDEAQNLPQEAMEELRMLSNFRSAGGGPLVQTFLIGQPELRRRIDSPELEQLRQRVIATFHLEPLDPTEVQSYVEHRLEKAGWKRDPDFPDETFPVIHEISGGTPRLINTLCDRVLLACFLDDLHTAEPETVREVAQESGIRSRSTVEPMPVVESIQGATGALEAIVPIASDILERLRRVEEQVGSTERNLRVEMLRVRRSMLRLLEEKNDAP